MAQRLKNMIGKVYDRLEVISLSYTGKRTSFWNCKCICGSEIEVRRTNLISGHTRSCGCLCKEETGNRFRTHGNSDSRAHSIWAGL